MSTRFGSTRSDFPVDFIHVCGDSFESVFLDFRFRKKVHVKRTVAMMESQNRNSAVFKSMDVYRVFFVFLQSRLPISCKHNNRVRTPRFVTGRSKRDLIRALIAGLNEFNELLLHRFIINIRL